MRAIRTQRYGAVYYRNSAGGSGTLILGSYSYYNGATASGGVEDFLQSLGATPTDCVAMDFTDGSSWSSIGSSWGNLSSFASWPGNACAGVDMLPDGTPSLTAFQSITAGAGDAAFLQCAQLVAAQFPNAIIRLGWEFNGDWFPWGIGDIDSAQVQAAFISAWQHIVGIFRGVSTGFLFLWNPTRGGSVPCESYYPGDSYADIIGLDVYNQEWGSWPGDSAEWQNMLTESYGLNWLVSFATSHGKSIALPEWACTAAASGSDVNNSPGDDPTFVTNIMGWCTNLVSEGYTVYCWPWDNGSDAWANFPNALAALEASIS